MSNIIDFISKKNEIQKRANNIRFDRLDRMFLMWVNFFTSENEKNDTHILPKGVRVNLMSSLKNVNNPIEMGSVELAYGISKNGSKKEALSNLFKSIKDQPKTITYICRLILKEATKI